jgi:short-subunit dehydrogenase
MKVTLITGASGGIGAAFAHQLAAQQHHLLLVARSADKLKVLSGQLEALYGVKAYYLAIDIAQPGSAQEIAREALSKDLEVHWLINNAGIGAGGDILEYSMDHYRHMMHLNMEAMVAITYQFLPQMRKNREGVIINVGSIAGFNPIPYMNVYAATKGFVMYFTQALHEENRLFNVTTMLLCPGATETGFFDAAKIGSDRKATFSSKNMETPEQVAAAAMKRWQKNDFVTISGWQNRMAVRLFKLFPKRMLMKLAGNMMRKNLNFKVQ